MEAYTIKSVLFDMDGVLIDSNSEIVKFWKNWTVKEGVTLSDEDIVKYIYGRTTPDTINELFHFSNDFIKKQILQDATDFDLNMRPDLIKGTSDFLRDLRQSLQKIGFVTSANITRAKKMLELHNIYDCFACAVTGDEVDKGKPNPEPYLRAAAKLDILTEDCLVFEDSDSGISSALAAGMYVISVNNNKNKNEKILANINDYTKLSIQNNFIMYDNKEIIKLLAE